MPPIMERNTNEYDADAIGGRAAGDDDQNPEQQEDSPDEPDDDDEGDGSVGLANDSDFGTE